MRFDVHDIRVIFLFNVMQEVRKNLLFDKCVELLLGFLVQLNRDEGLVDFLVQLVADLFICQVINQVIARWGLAFRDRIGQVIAERIEQRLVDCVFVNADNDLVVFRRCSQDIPPIKGNAVIVGIAAI